MFVMCVLVCVCGSQNTAHKLHTFCMCRLQEEYPQWFEKPVLEMVHHNTVSLDKLVEMAWVEILTKYAVDEECDFLVRIISQ